MSAGELRAAELSHFLPEQGQNLLTLEPLRTDGPNCLVPTGISSIAKVTLQKIASPWDNTYHERTIAEAADIFRCVASDAIDHDPVPEGAVPIYALFVIQFTDLRGIKR